MRTIVATAVATRPHWLRAQVCRRLGRGVNGREVPGPGERRTGTAWVRCPVHPRRIHRGGEGLPMAIRGRHQMRILVVLLGFALTLYCLIDLWQTRLNDTETLPRPAWIVIVALLPFVGPITWLLFGRPAHDDESDDISLTRH